jgi:hypothetical protein
MRFKLTTLTLIASCLPAVAQPDSPLSFPLFTRHLIDPVQIAGEARGKG